MRSQKLQATAIVRKDSVAFVETVLALQAAGRTVVTVTTVDSANSLPGVAIDRCIVPPDQTGWFEARRPLIHHDTTAQIAYTSGTEGAPKGIVLTHANLASTAERIIDQMQLTAEIREYVAVPATFSFGMARYRAISAVGGKAYLPPRGFDPNELARMLAAGEVNALSLVPTLLRVLLAAADIIGDAGPRLRWMEIGSQHMTVQEKRLARALFPNARIVQHYGLTEASRTTFLDIPAAPDAALGSVGRPINDIEVALSADGRIRIRGPHVARSSIDAEGLHDLVDAQGWLQTNDLGHMRDGLLFFDGRADELINYGGIKLAPEQLEDRIRARLGAATVVAVAKVADAVLGDAVLVAGPTGATDISRLRDAAVAALQDMGITARSGLHVMEVAALPLTATGKVKRQALAQEFASRNMPLHAARAPATDGISDILAFFEHEFPGRTIRPDDTFMSLGGDSLHYISFMLAFEQRFGPLPDNWETLSLSDLQRSSAATPAVRWQRLETVTLTRAFFMACIVALHTDAFIYSWNWGAAYFLILLAGYSVARFQLPDVLATGSVKPILATALYVAVPTVLMIALLQLVTRKFELLPLLLVSNFIDPHGIRGFLFYFTEFYVQIFLLVALMFSFASVRRAFRLRPMLSALVLLVSVIIFARSLEYVWDQDYNYHRTPWHYAWPFALGMVVGVAQDARSRFVALAATIAAVLVAWGPTSAAFYVAGGTAAVLFVRNIVVPVPVKLVAGEIAASSLFIYLCHYQVIDIVEKVTGEKRPWLALFAAIIVGIVAARVYAVLERKVRQTWFLAAEAGDGVASKPL